MSQGFGVRLTFIEPIRQLQMLEMIDPPVVPVVGDLSESPDGKLWVVTQRAFIPPVSSSLLVTKPTIDHMLEIRCMIAQINEDGSYVDAAYYRRPGEPDAE